MRILINLYQKLSLHLHKDSLLPGVEKNKNFIEYLFSFNTSRQSILTRITFLIFVFITLYIILIIRLFDISMYNDENNHRRNLYGYNKFHKKRKEIIDRNGNLLAVNLSTASLYANPKKMIDKEEALSKLQKILPELNIKDLREKLHANKSFVWIKRDLTPKEQYGINNLGIPGLYFEEEQKRVYTYSNLTSHVIGFVGRDEDGLAGVEKFFDKSLSYQDMLLEYKDRNKPLQLSLDIRVQNIVSEELDYTIQKFSAKGGAGIVADVNSGEILALVSKPDFDPHYPGEADEDHLFNRASLGTYELGSIFKVLTMAIGLDSKKVSLYDVYNLTHPLRIAKYTIKDYHPKPGWRTIAEIFMYSSNIGVSQIVLEVGKDAFKKYLKKLGLMEKVPIELPEKATPLYPPNKSWGDLSTVTMSYGHGLSISPLHFVQAMIPAVNGGTLYPLTIIKRDNDSLPKIVEKVFNESTSYQLNKLLRLVVEKGTGRKAEVKGYLPGGKTGTANKSVTGKYSKNERLSSFVATFPTVNPRFVILVMIDSPKGIKESFGFATGGWTAAPTTGNIISRLAPLYGIVPYDEESVEVKNILHIDYMVDDAI